MGSVIIMDKLSTKLLVLSKLNPMQKARRYLIDDGVTEAVLNDDIMQIIN